MRGRYARQCSTHSAAFLHPTQRRFAAAGAALNATFWGSEALQLGCLRYDDTHRRAWTIMQA